MGSHFSIPLWSPRNELGLELKHVVQTNFPNIASLKLQPAKGLLLAAAGTPAGVLALVDVASGSVQQSLTVNYTYGGVSELCWIGSEILAVGTTRGHIIIFSTQNDAKRLNEVCSVKAHGDGAAQIGVESLDYNASIRTIVSVAEGVGFIRFWTVNEDGTLAARPIPAIPITSYILPRFAAFTDNGSKVVVGFLQKAIVQVFSLDPWELLITHTLGGSGQCHNMASAVFLHEACRFAVLDIENGIHVFESSNYAPLKSGLHSGVDDTCTQGLASLAQGRYVASVQDGGRVVVYKSVDASRVFRLNIRARHHKIEAIDSQSSGSNGDVLIASSSAPGKLSSISVWTNQDLLASSTKANTSPDYHYAPHTHFLYLGNPVIINDIRVS